MTVSIETISTADGDPGAVDSATGVGPDETLAAMPTHQALECRGLVRGEMVDVGLRVPCPDAGGQVHEPFEGGAFLSEGSRSDAHDGNQARAPEEIDCIRRLVADLLAGAGWRDRDGDVRPLTAHDILIVAPYNARSPRSRRPCRHSPTGSAPSTASRARKRRW